MDHKEADRISDKLREPLIKAGSIEVMHNGATVLPKDKELSQGCQACKSGAWICIYIGVDCNLECAHCPQIGRHKTALEHIWANGGDDTIHYPDDLKRVIRRNPQIKGISFSGGEPFKYFDTMIEWLKYINTELKEKYYLWVYTNGTLVKEEQLKKLGELGVQEIRFDHASTNYSTKTIEIMKISKKYIKYLTVEVPALPKLQQKLLDILSVYQSIKLDFLQLHELQVNDDNFNRLPGEDIDYTLNYKNKNGGQFNLDSTFLIYEVINEIINKKYDIIFNDCSSRNYTHQSLGFRLQRNNMNPAIAQENWESFYKRAVENGHAS